MSDWQGQTTSAMEALVEVVALAGDSICASELEIEFHNAPHRPTGLPRGKMAVYAFWGNGEWIKVGKVGPNSDARFRSQHYQPGRAASSLANSLCKDQRMISVQGFAPEQCGNWIRAHTHRCNIFVAANKPKSLLSLLETFLHHRLKPRYAG